MLHRLTHFLNNFFYIRERGSTISTEVRGGFVTFLTISYILLVNPQVLRGAYLDTDNTATATAIVTCLGTVFGGIFTNLPLAIGPGMGLNTYLSSAVSGGTLTSAVALTAVFLSGVLGAIFSALGVTSFLTDLLPGQLKSAIMIGLGFYQAFIGCTQVDLVVPHYFTSPPVQLGNVWSAQIILACLGVMLIGFLLIHKVKGAMLIGILGVTILAWITKVQELPQGVISLPSLYNIAGFSFPDYFGDVGHALTFTIAITLIAWCDIAGVLYAASRLLRIDLSDLNTHHNRDESPELQPVPGPESEGVHFSGRYQLHGGLDDGSDLGGITKSLSIGSSMSSIEDSQFLTPRALTLSFFIIGIGTMLSGLLSCSPVIVLLECSAGIKEGARTGLAAVVTGSCTLIALFFIPVFNAIPVQATAPVLIVLGALMIQSVKMIDWGDLRVGLPCFLCIAMMPFTSDISVGIAFGIVAWIILHLDRAVAWCWREYRKWTAKLQ